MQWDTKVRYFSVCFFQAEDGILDIGVTGVQTCALPIYVVGAGPGAARPDRLEGRHAMGEGGPDALLEQRPVGLLRRGIIVAPVRIVLSGRRRDSRSGERRVGKECRSRRWPHHQKKQATK